jgi:ribonuclease BN (tRNA processing enzyme)
MVLRLIARADPQVFDVCEIVLRGLGCLRPVYGLDPVENLAEIAPGDIIDLGDSVSLGATKVPHTDESVAYSISRNGRRLVYTGDTGYDPMFGEWARGADVLLCECSLPTALAIPTHLTPEQCGALAAAALPKHLVLTHFYPPVEQVDIVAAVAAHDAGPVTLANDGDTFEIEEG